MADVYRIGVSIGLKDNASQVVSALASKFLGLNIAVGDVQKNMNKLRLAAVGVAAVWGGTKLLEGMNSLANAGAKLQEQQTAMLKAGMSHLEVTQETARAYRSMSEVRGPDVTDRIKSLLELRSIVGAGKDGRDYREINALLPSFLKVRTLYGDEGSKDIFRVVEQQGGARFKNDGSFDDERFNRYLDAAVKVLQASVGTITPRDLKNVMSMASVTARGMDPTSFWGAMMTPIIEMGGYRAGTAMTAMSRAFYGGIMPQRNAEELGRLGIISGVHVLTERERKARHIADHLSRQDRRDLVAKGYKFGKDGRIILSSGALIGSNVLNDPTQGFFPWLRDFIAPKFREDYQKNVASRPGNTETFDAYIRNEIYKALPTETARRFGALIIQQLTSVSRDQTLMKQAVGLGAYDLAQQNYSKQLDNFQHSWQSLLQTLGLPAAEDGAKILKQLGTGIDAITQAAHEHPEATKNIIRLAAGIGVLGAASGAAAIAGLALAPLAKGVRLFAGVMASEEAVMAPSYMRVFGLSAITLSKAMKVAALGLAAHELLNYVDPKDKTGAWVDKHIPGASWVDNAFSHIGLGRSYDEQRRVQNQLDGKIEVTVQPAPIMLDGKQIGQAVFEAGYKQTLQELRASGPHADWLSTPQFPGAAGAH